jgi:hypothetical protein
MNAVISMPPLNRNPVSSLMIALFSFATLTGCAAWKKQQTPPQSPFTGPSHPHLIRVTLAGGKRLELKNPSIRGDSLVGSMPSNGRWPGPWDDPEWVETGLPLADVRLVELRKVDAGRTLLFAAAGIGATVAIVAITSSTTPPTPTPSSGGSGGTGDGCIFCSCPLLDSWDGTRWVLDSGTFGGAFLRPLAYTDFDNLEALTAERGVARLRLKAGDQETDHIDELAVLAVDHDPSVTIATDPSGKIHTIGRSAPPLTATDSQGKDVLALVSAQDERSWESPLAVRDTASADQLRDGLILEFARPAGVREACLVLRAHKTAWAGYLMRSFVRAHGSAISAWYAAMDSDAVRATQFRAALEEEVHLKVSLWKEGRWTPQASVWGGGPEIAKTHAIPLNLGGLAGDLIRIRLESVPSFWLVDWAALDASAEQPFEIQTLKARSASSSRGGNLGSALESRDGRDLILETGDEIDLTYAVPPLAAGKARSYLSRATGWYRFHTPETGAPDTTLLAGLFHRQHGISRISIAWMNRAIRELN